METTKLMRLELNHPTDRPNFTEVNIGDLTIWFSYTTPVAYMYPGEGRVVAENVWSRTTGRHLNYIDDGNKANRWPHWIVMERLTRFAGEMGLVIDG